MSHEDLTHTTNDVKIFGMEVWLRCGWTVVRVAQFGPKNYGQDVASSEEEDNA